MNEHANRLISLRKKMRLTQKELGKEFGVTAGAIAHWENGVRPIPGPIIRLIEIYEGAINAKKSINEKKVES